MLFGLRRKLGRCAVWRGCGEASGQAGIAELSAQDRPVRLSEVLASVTAPPDDEVRVVLERSGSALVVSAGGSVDASNVAVWRRLVGEAAAVTAVPGPLIVDASGLEFMAVCAFGVLIEESARCRRRGIELCLVSGQPIVDRVVKAVGLDGELSFCATIDDALGGTPRV
ncbi:anti-sigma factor antagonist [Mycobacterium sp. CSUR Q5927]|nr:anti-sigma factor antagonist [Mycobacterium sp. CSUR Q5927]